MQQNLISLKLNQKHIQKLKSESESCSLRPGQNTAVGSCPLLQGSNPGLPHCRWILYLLSHQGSPRILEWVTCPFSSGSSRPRNRTRLSCIAGGFFTSWATREALQEMRGLIYLFIFFLGCITGEKLASAFIYSLLIRPMSVENSQLWPFLPT